MRINTWRLFLAVLWAVLIGVGAGSAIPVEIPEKYADDPSAAWFPDGPVGKCLAVFTGPALEYPVWFGQSNPPAGALSCWFKPTRAIDYDRQMPVKLSGVGEIAIYGDQATPQRLTYPGGSRLLSNDFHQTFHHMVFTWSPQCEQTWLDGAKVYEKVFGNQPAPARSLGQAQVNIHAPHGCLVDEVLVLDRCMPADEITALAKNPAAWAVDSNTVFYAGFDGTLAVRGWVQGGGDVLRMDALIGRVDATFRAGDQTRFTFAVLNATSTPKSLELKGVARDLEKKVVLDKTLTVTAAAGALTLVDFPLDEIAANGLFWGVFTLVEGGRVAQTMKIPFAKTLAVDPRACTGDDMRSGFTCAKGTLPPTYQKWGLIHYDGWKSLEPEEGRWYFDRLDLKVNSLLASGSIPIIMLDDPPEWYRQRVKSRGYMGYYYPDTEDEAGMALWKKYVRNLGERYKGKVHDYEVFGEAYGRSEPRHYGRLVAITADELHAVDPAIKVVCNYAGYHDWAQGVAKEVAGKADVFTFHPYGWVGGANHLQLGDETILEPYAQFLRQALAQNPDSTRDAWQWRWANTEYGCYQLLGLAIHEDGYPMTAAEFDASIVGKDMPAFYTKRGRISFVDWYTGAFRAVRGHTLNLVADCKYALWWSSVGGSMISDLQFAPHTPSPESVAYANITGLLNGCKFVRRLDLGAGYLRGYLFRKSEGAHPADALGKRGNPQSTISSDFRLVAFTDRDEAEIFLRLDGSGLQVRDHYANPFPHARDGNVIKFKLQSNIPVLLSGIARLDDGGPVLGVYAPAEHACPGLPARVRVSLHNPLERELRGTLRLVMPEPFAAIPARAVRLAGDAGTNLEFDVAVPQSVLHNQTMRAEFAADDAFIGTAIRSDVLPIRLSTIARPAKQPVRLDGDLSQWGDAAQFQAAIDDPEQVIMGIPYTKLYMMNQHVDWSGTNDLSARAAVQYDGENLYVAVRVWDNKVMNLARNEPIYIYEGDCIELFVDGRGPAGQGSPTYSDGVYHIKFAPSMDPVLPPFHHVSKPRRGMEIPGLAYASKLQPDGYTYIVKIPRAAFPEFEFKPGASMGFAMHLGDQDEKGGMDAFKAKTVMLWGGEKGVSGDPSKFGRIIIGGAE